MTRELTTTETEIALKSHQQVLLKNPKDLDAQIMCGNLCVELGKFEEAAGYFRRIVRVLKNNMPANNALCFALQALGNKAHQESNFLQAEACFEEALEYQPHNAAFWYNLGNAQRELNQAQKAVGSFKQAIKFDANDAEAHNNLGNVLREVGQLDKAILAYENALTINPNLHHAIAHLVHQRQHACDWVGTKNNSLTKQINTLRELVKSESSAQISPFAFLAMPNTTPLEQKICASNYANLTFKHLIDVRQSLNFKHKKTQKTTLKIGYLSADFRLHPLAFLIKELIENHDKDEFETFAYSYGADDKSPERQQLMRAFDHFNDIRLLNDADAANKIYSDNIDILVDLTGYTQSSRTGLVALKPAPICINWLGYPGTMGELAGEPLFDYLLADHYVASDACNFAEQLLFLPFYQPNNASRPVGQSTTRAQNNLPESAFVYCCFNQSFKITAELFTVWMQILQAVPNSVLWLLDCNQWAKANLEAAAELANINKERLIFAPRLPIADHLARHVHADLFLDTLPYNAHTTASDALFMGLPLLTCEGDTFASRVAASLLNRIDCKALIATDLNDYQHTAILLANNAKPLLQLKQQIKRNIAQYEIFNPAYFMQQLSKVYEKIWRSHINNV
ncbi:MAG: tetratricopeptide repeat protein [Bdellovibrio sp.]|nr:tetratricopeptide repeat protein [Methylotenera sp.]